MRLPLTPGELARGQRLGELLRRSRGAQSIPEVAAAAEVSPETLRKIESGRIATPAFTTIAAIAAVLDMSLDGLWGEISRVSEETGPDEPSAASGGPLAS
ncbi:helix-turn-helix protein [Rarobacter faecitabidus]|uniref:Helix-turn-helix protein n=1 Tax=Rarobacter faecitabidus TaxID=13243 RepID=A0A542ZW75_RARFA|nr:helix-turn-helix protein [Rarobacter faecitabidus]